MTISKHSVLDIFSFSTGRKKNKDKGENLFEVLLQIHNSQSSFSPIMVIWAYFQTIYMRYFQTS